jgi:hypothetical protein
LFIGRNCTSFALVLDGLEFQQAQVFALFPVLVGFFSDVNWRRIRNYVCAPHYDAGDERCIVTVHATKTKLFVTGTSVRVVVETRTNPLGLVDAFTKSRDKMIELAGPSVRLLN